MILKKMTTTLATIAFLMLGITGVYVTTAQGAEEVTDSSALSSCPITGALTVAFNFPSKEERPVEDQLSEIIELTNSSKYVLGGVKIGVGIYRAKTDTVPTYWTVLPEQHILKAEESINQHMDLDLSALPAGSYIVKVFAFQGNETALLGSALRDVSKTEGLKIIKSTPQSSQVNIRVEVNGQVATGPVINLAENTPINVKIVTTNKNDKPLLLNSRMNAIINQGDIPLGAAVRNETLDSVKLVPGSNRTTELEERSVEWGVYTIYAALISDGTLQPLISVPINIGDRAGKGFWAYVSQIGLSDFPLQTESEVVACVQYTGYEMPQTRFLELMGVDINLSDEQGNVFSQKQISSEVDTNNFFSFSPNTEFSDFTLKFDFLEELVKPVLNKEQSVSGERPDNLTVVDSQALQFSCGDSGCAGDTVHAQTGFVPASSQDEGRYPFWFYAAIVIAASLLMYIMLRRLPPETIGKGKKPDANELL